MPYKDKRKLYAAQKRYRQRKRKRESELEQLVRKLRWELRSKKG